MKESSEEPLDALNKMDADLPESNDFYKNAKTCASINFFIWAALYLFYLFCTPINYGGNDSDIMTFLVLIFVISIIVSIVGIINGIQSYKTREDITQKTFVTLINVMFLTFFVGIIALVCFVLFNFRAG